MYIRQIRISLEGSDRVGVIPKLSPTVAMAEKDSNRQAISGSPSMILIVRALTVPRIVYIKKIAIAVATISAAILRLNISGLSLRVNTAAAQVRRTAMVVVLIPPAVDPASADHHQEDHEKLSGFSHGGEIRSIKAGGPRGHGLEQGDKDSLSCRDILKFQEEEEDGRDEDERQEYVRMTLLCIRYLEK